LALFIDRGVQAHAVLDGEVACFDSKGRLRFNELILRARGDPAFVAIDVLALDGRDLRELPLIERKKTSRRLIPHRSLFVASPTSSRCAAATSTDSFACATSRGSWRSERPPRTRPDVMPSSRINIKKLLHRLETSSRCRAGSAAIAFSIEV
jgi:ATP-dependent DNA ligase